MLLMPLVALLRRQDAVLAAVQTPRLRELSTRSGYQELASGTLCCGSAGAPWCKQAASSVAGVAVVPAGRCAAVGMCSVPCELLRT